MMKEVSANHKDMNVLYSFNIKYCLKKRYLRNNKIIVERLIVKINGYKLQNYSKVALPPISSKF